MMNNIAQSIKKIDQSLSITSIHAILVQGEVNAVLEQSGVLFRQDPVYSSFASNINSALEKTKGVASILLHECLEDYYRSLIRLQNYFSMHRSVVANTVKEASREQWVDSLRLLRSMVLAYQENTVLIKDKINKILIKLYDINRFFSRTVRDFNEAINGDNGELSVINHKLHRLNIAIDGTFSAVLVANVLITGATILIIVGGFAYSTGLRKYFKENWGFSKGIETYYYVDWRLVAAGFVTSILGTGGSVAGLVEINRLFHEKSEALFTKSTIEVEVKLALGVSDFCGHLAMKVENFESHLKRMEENVGALTDSLIKIEKDLRGGLTSAEETYGVFWGTVDVIDKASQDINIIKNKIAAVEIIKDDKGQLIDNVILNNATPYV